MSHDPVVVTCLADLWTLVAANVTTLALHKIGVPPALYLQTYRKPGTAAPVNDDDAAVLFGPGETSSTWSNDASADVYVKAVRADGAVRVDQ